MQKFMQILATLALLLVLALVIPLTLAACGGKSGTTDSTAAADLPQYLSVLRAAMDTLDKVQQGAQAPEERS